MSGQSGLFNILISLSDMKRWQIGWKGLELTQEVPFAHRRWPCASFGALLQHSPCWTPHLSAPAVSCLLLLLCDIWQINVVRLEDLYNFYSLLILWPHRLPASSWTWCREYQKSLKALKITSPKHLCLDQINIHINLGKVSSHCSLRIQPTMPASFVEYWWFRIIKDISEEPQELLHRAILRLGSKWEETASSARRAHVSLFGVRGQGMRIGNLFTRFSSLSTLWAIYVTFFHGRCWGRLASSSWKIK